MIKYIYLRNSLDWCNLKSIEDYVKANRNSRKLIKDWMPQIIDSIEQWNNCFNITYFEFRAEMKEIMLSSIHQIKDAIVINKEKKFFLSTEDNFLIYPIDDDDWVSFEVFDCVLESVNEKDDIAVWPFGFFRQQVSTTDINKPIDDIRYVYSNNSILTKKGYKKFCRMCGGCNFLEDHRKCDLYCKSDDCTVKIIHRPLSGYNHSPASATKLWSFSKFKNANESILSLASEYKKFPEIPPELNWSFPYVRRFWDLIFSLKSRKLFL